MYRLSLWLHVVNTSNNHTACHQTWPAVTDYIRPPVLSHLLGNFHQRLSKLNYALVLGQVLSFTAAMQCYGVAGLFGSELAT